MASSELVKNCAVYSSNPASAGNEFNTVGSIMHSFSEKQHLLHIS